MSDATTQKISAYSKTDSHESLLALMGWYGKTDLMEISEQQALAFLDLLERGVVHITNSEDEGYVYYNKSDLIDFTKMCANGE